MKTKELGPLGIRSCAVAPGFFDTPSTHAALSADHVRTIRGEIPLRRLGVPAGTVRFAKDHGDEIHNTRNHKKKQYVFEF